MSFAFVANKEASFSRLVEHERRFAMLAEEHKAAVAAASYGRKTGAEGETKDMLFACGGAAGKRLYLLGKCGELFRAQARRQFLRDAVRYNRRFYRRERAKCD